MNFRTYFSKVRYLLPVLLLLAFTAQAESHKSLEDTNTALVQQAFENWQQGRGSVFDLLAEDAQWTVAGVSPVSDTYNSKQALVEGAVEPIHARLQTAITPTVRHLIAQGNSVVVLWDGAATAMDGARYANSYAWHLVMRDGRITQVTAFLDTWALTELMK
ncbi:nuclear transport factor 2 family protein [Halopseudomonas pelagia]|uniref:nuclear transport factor 2 family protein n=1 Tax=Halopseudomonas pelagia TaxID=553151 RepID=UPI00039FBAB5|nr:nuclear transport factor 2 family protein [Halopseudomonas pelagia]|tara:strand:- start:955 stop:1437 length:483 start_codon:yes stop_codon:yes gene_type:complete